MFEMLLYLQISRDRRPCYSALHTIRYAFDSWIKRTRQPADIQSSHPRTATASSSTTHASLLVFAPAQTHVEWWPISEEIRRLLIDFEIIVQQFEVEVPDEAGDHKLHLGICEPFADTVLRPDAEGLKNLLVVRQRLLGTVRML